MCRRLRARTVARVLREKTKRAQLHAYRLHIILRICHCHYIFNRWKRWIFYPPTDNRFPPERTIWILSRTSRQSLRRKIKCAGADLTPLSFQKSSRTSLVYRSRYSRKYCFCFTAHIRRAPLRRGNYSWMEIIDVTHASLPRDV